MNQETSYEDCPECKGKETLTINRWYYSEEALELGLYNWKESCSECEYENEHFEFI